MHLLNLFIAVLAPATLIDGLPTQDTHEQSNIATRNNTFVSHVRVKRDVPLTARDIEEADQHGVDLNKMYKHSILKHSNGSEYSIWVHNSFDPDVKDDEKSADDVSDLGKRSWEEQAYAKDRMPNRFEFDDHTDTCAKSDFKKKTNNRSPFANGADALIDWTVKHKGGWRIGATDSYYSTDILIGGTNMGANMRFSVRKEPGRIVILGTKDVGDAVVGAYNKFKQDIKGVARMAGKGKMKCWDGNNGKNMLHWEIDRSDREIEFESATKEQPNPKPTQQHQEPEYQPEAAPKTVYYPVPVSLQTIYPPPPFRPPLYTPAQAPGPEPTTAPKSPPLVYPAPQSPPLVYPAPKSSLSVSPATITKVSQSISPGVYQPGEGPTGFPESFFID
ncbi:uncharacterized protein FPRO_06868 [Fusarium proliferatum ET1]|uniref:Ecp2 effector protein-like domain-containing protein n=1 Tax=Fusarium proliferatum (strain ET1) TaxID=1227346 RepID=A0A1L7VB33_FUSPR|nr:uncharacterized protein FPRO_06868 [Fusarium proliferatum ET1]CZR37941.1 uncharacterized protein FPRO_06868 [Fusarium proliferatum ET1]